MDSRSRVPLPLSCSLKCFLYHTLSLKQFSCASAASSKEPGSLEKPFILTKPQRDASAAPDDTCWLQTTISALSLVRSLNLLRMIQCFIKAECIVASDNARYLSKTRCLGPIQRKHLHPGAKDTCSANLHSPTTLVIFRVVARLHHELGFAYCLKKLFLVAFPWILVSATEKRTPQFLACRSLIFAHFISPFPVACTAP